MKTSIEIVDDLFERAQRLALRHGYALWAIPWPCVHEHHGVSELWLAERDFTKFPQLAVRNLLD